MIFTTCIGQLNFDMTQRMRSARDGKPSKTWVTSSRKGFRGIRRTASCLGFQCENNYVHSLSTMARKTDRRVVYVGKNEITMLAPLSKYVSLTMTHITLQWASDL